MSNVDRYLAAASRSNTVRSYAAAVRHFEVEWGGKLPATADDMARYLADFAGTLAVNTLRQRLAALGKWHTEQGFVDPTRAPRVRKVLKGIASVHGGEEKRAAPLQIDQLAKIAGWLDAAAVLANEAGDRSQELRNRRDRALILLGFWRGFRSDELVHLQVEDLRVFPGEGMTCFLSRSKGDRENVGVTYKVPALSRCCPVDAVTQWLQVTSLKRGPLFRAVRRDGGISGRALHGGSIIALLRRVFTQAGLAGAQNYSSHSLRRGFASWANDNGWSLKSLMEYVGWKDVNSAMRYLEGGDPFSRARIEQALTAPALMSDGADDL